MKTALSFVAGVALCLFALSAAAAETSFSLGSLVGTYTGNVQVSENIADGNGGGYEAEFNELMVLTFDGLGNASGTASVAGRIVPGTQPQIGCQFAQSGTYTVNADGTGVLSFDLVSDQCGTSTGTMTFAIGGLERRRRLDVIVTSADSNPPGSVNSITGHGSLLSRR